MLTHLIHFAMLDAFSAGIIWMLYSLYSHIHSKKDKTENATTKQDNKQDIDEDEDDEDDEPYHQIWYLDHAMTVRDYQRACLKAELDHLQWLDKNDIELVRNDLRLLDENRKN